jgi:hypothetical protein
MVRFRFDGYDRQRLLYPDLKASRPAPAVGDLQAESGGIGRIQARVAHQHELRPFPQPLCRALCTGSSSCRRRWMTLGGRTVRILTFRTM